MLGFLLADIAVIITASAEKNKFSNDPGLFIFNSYSTGKVG